MVLVIVLVHAVSSHEVEIGIVSFDYLAHTLDVFGIVVVVDGIGLRLAHDAAVGDVIEAGETDRDQFALCQRDEIFIARLPQAVPFEAKVLEPVAVRRIRHHFRRPGLVVLNATDLYRRIVDVDPVVGKLLAVFSDQGHGEEVAILQRPGRANGVFRQSRPQRFRKLAQWRRTDDVIGDNFASLAIPRRALDFPLIH